MGNLSFTLCALVMAHFLCDYPLQGDFVSKFKARFVDEKYNPMWGWILSAHAGIHALPVLLLTNSLWLVALMFFSHFFIDFLKCEKKISFNQDQTFHLLIILVISVLATGAMPWKF